MPPPPEDYYVTLGLPLEPPPDAEDIKKAYRRCALAWHPDKHSGGSAAEQDAATERFKTIQAAYSVLSDPNERAWYDAHKADILGGRGRAGGGGGGDDDGEGGGGLTNLFSFFSASAFAGFDDSDGGFFATFRRVFEAIAAEEGRLVSEALRGEPRPAFPTFGAAGSSDSVVTAFYSFWSDYSSRMSFAWADLANPSEAPNRYVRRAMEKDNEVARRAARRERTDEIRALVQFVKNRDRRVMAAAAAARKRVEAETARRKAAAEADKVSRKAAAAITAEEAAEEAAALEREFAGAFRLADEDDAGRSRKQQQRRGGGAVSAAVVRSDSLGGLEGGAGGDGGASPASGGAAAEAAAGDIGSSDDEDGGSLFSCDLCSKYFKSHAAQESHERSKKHIALAAKLAALVAAEESDEEDSDEESAEREGDSAESTEEEGKEGEGGSNDRRRSVYDGSAVGDDDEGECDEEDAEGKATKGGAAASATQPPEAEEGGAQDVSGHGLVRSRSSSTSGDERGKKKPLNKTQARLAAKAAARAAAATATGGAAAVGGARVKKNPPDLAARLDPSVISGGSRGNPQSALNKAGHLSDIAARLGAGGVRRAGNEVHHADVAVAAAGGRGGGGAKARKEKGGEEAAGAAPGLQCGVCSTLFVSRNALFEHIKGSGHAMPKEAPAESKSRRKRGGGD